MRVFQNPEKFLVGPNSEVKGAKKRFLVGGGGAAGLVTSYMLLKVGHHVS